MSVLEHDPGKRPSSMVPSEVAKPKRGRSRGPRGEAKHRRKVLAEARRTAIPGIDHKIFEQRHAVRRLAEVNDQLDPKKNTDLPSLNPQAKAILEFEQVLLRQRVGEITPDQRRAQTRTMLEAWERQDPEMYNWLTSEEDHGGKSPLVQITEKIFPPPSISGYTTKGKR